MKSAFLFPVLILLLATAVSVRGADRIVPPGSIPTETERKEYERIDRELSRITTVLAAKETLAPERQTLEDERAKLQAERKKLDAERARRAVPIPGAMYYKDASGRYPDFSAPEATIQTVYAALKRKDFAVLQASRLSNEKIDHSGHDVAGFRIVSSKSVERSDQWAKPGDWEIIVQESLPENRPPLHMWYLLRKSESQWKIAESVWAADENYPDPCVAEDETAK